MTSTNPNQLITSHPDWLSRLYLTQLIRQYCISHPVGATLRCAPNLVSGSDLPYFSSYTQNGRDSSCPDLTQRSIKSSNGSLARLGLHRLPSMSVTHQSCTPASSRASWRSINVTAQHLSACISRDRQRNSCRLGQVPQYASNHSSSNHHRIIQPRIRSRQVPVAQAPQIYLNQSH